MNKNNRKKTAKERAQEDMERIAGRKLLWHYTPSQNSHADLEAIFVQRESIVADAVERMRESILTGGKHHLLFVGPRGSGKTHLVSLVYHRLNAMKDLQEKGRMAWLNEDEMSPSFLDLLVRIYRALESQYPSEFTKEALEPVYDYDSEHAEEFMKHLLLEKLGSRVLIVIVENLDELLKGLKTKGQMKWRAFMQETRQCATLATAQKLTDAVKKRKAPFHGTFQVENLVALSLDQSVDLLKKIAVFYEDEILLNFLNQEAGKSRVRALHLLTGGNHRVIIVLAQFVTKESLDELIELFMKMLNELTPYYQERLRWLSAQQRKIIGFLSSANHPLTVKTMARRLFITEQTLSSQLRDLRSWGYVKSVKSGRESLYQMSEPLMRMCIEVKENHQSEPIRLIVEFLKIWCSKETLLKHLAINNGGTAEAIKCLQSAVDTFEEGGFLKNLKDVQDFAQYKDIEEQVKVILASASTMDETLLSGIEVVLILANSTKPLKPDGGDIVITSSEKFEAQVTTLLSKCGDSHKTNLNHVLNLNQIVRGCFCFANQDYKSSKKAYTQAIASESEEYSSIAYLGVAACHTMLGNYSAAAEIFIKSLNDLELSSELRSYYIPMARQGLLKRMDSVEDYFTMLEKISTQPESEQLLSTFVYYFKDLIEDNVASKFKRKGIQQFISYAENSESEAALAFAAFGAVCGACQDDSISLPEIKKSFKLWREEVKGHKIISATLHECQTVISYCESTPRDEKILLNLNDEMRGIALDVLGLADDEGDSTS